MKIIRTKAIVLRRTNYGESDRIVQFLTPEHGKLSVMAKSVRKEKSKLAGGIELFARCDITVNTGRGGLAVLTGTRLEKFYGYIMTDYDRLQFGYESIKQVSKAADMIDEPAFFELLDQTFTALDNDTIQLAIIKAWFWLQLAILLGTPINISTDNNGMKLVEGAQYNFDTINQVFLFHEDGRFSSNHIRLLRLLSAQAPQVSNQVADVDKFIGDCLWLAEHAVQH